MDYQEIAKLADKVRRNVSKVIIGKEEQFDLIFSAMIAGGHVLLEDVPGTGKTVMARSIAASMHCDFSRLQFTPDLLPADITGMSVFKPSDGTFQFVPGPVFTHILLADEINRATPRTQSALLECMEEKQVTEGGVTRKLERPFLVIATKADKLSKSAQARQLAPIYRALQVQPWQVIAYSSETGAGRDQLLAALETALAQAAIPEDEGPSAGAPGAAENAAAQNAPKAP